jgi:hypothetical protein
MTEFDSLASGKEKKVLLGIGVLFAMQTDHGG